MSDNNMRTFIEEWLSRQGTDENYMVAKARAALAAPAPVAQGAHVELLKESAELFRFYEQSHRARGPEHLTKAERNAEIAGRIEAALAAPAPVAQGGPCDRFSREQIMDSMIEAEVGDGAFKTMLMKMDELEAQALGIKGADAAPAPVAQRAISQALEALEKAGDLDFYAAKARRILRKATGQEGGAA